MKTAQPFRATVLDVFQITGRGCAIVLENGFQGTVRVGQVLKIGGQSVRVDAVEMVDRISEAKSWVAIVIDARHSMLAKGQIGTEVLDDAS